MLGATLEWAKDDAGEIGRIKPDPPGTVRLDITHGSVMETQAHLWSKK